jgi:SOS-response transcriptional repressor LexA
MAIHARMAKEPVWAEPIKALRKKLNLTQADLAAELGVSGMAVSRWERGVQEPPAQYYISMGNMVGTPECWVFWRFAGLRREDVQRVANDAPKPEDILKAPPQETVSIPVLKIAATDGPGPGPSAPMSLADADIEFHVGVPRWWCTETCQVVGIRVMGRSMSPLIPNGSVVAVDTTEQTKAKLNDKIVVATRDEQSFRIAWLRESRGEYFLSPENREFPPVSVISDPRLRIIGRVLWWITSAPDGSEATLTGGD